MKILVIDDSPEIPDLIKFCAGKLQAEIIIEHYHPELGKPNEQFNWHEYALLILDIKLGLPDQNGFDWLGDIKQHNDIPPILIMTAYGSEDVAIHAIKKGADDYLNKKNLTPERLTQRIKALLNVEEKTKSNVNGQTEQPGYEQTVPLSTPKVKDLLKTEDKASANANKKDGYEQTVPLSTPKVKDLLKAESKARANANMPNKKEGFEQTVPLSMPLVKELMKAEDKKVNDPDEQDNKNAIQETVPLSTDDLKRIKSGTESTNKNTPQSKEKKPGNKKTPTKNKFIINKTEVDVPGYHIIRKVAQGGMATVYLAERTKDKIQVILKIINFMDEKTAQLFKRFISEFKLVSKLKHHNIISVYERSITGHFAYIAMEYCHGGDLSERLDYALPPEIAESYMRQIADGIGAAHKAGIIHRDLKPGNILFRVDDSIAIADFGIAKLQSAETNITKAGLSLGTVLYISPEQIIGEKVGRYSDLYSMGIIFYIMLTGDYPFFSNSLEKILKAHLKAPVPKLPAELSNYQPVIDGLLAKDPADRFQDTDQFLSGLAWD